MRDLLVPAVGREDHVRGPSKAPITLVEFGDYECPLCGRAYAIIKQVLEEVGEHVRFVFRNFPLADVHPHAWAAAEAAESVAARGGAEAFWKMHDLIFQNQDALQPDDLIEYAAAAGIDAEAVADDLANGATRERVQRDLESGERSGISGTPAFFVNGRRFEGDWTDVGALTEALQDGTRGRSYITH